MVSLASYWIGSEEESAVREPFPPHPSREEREFVREVPVLVCVTGGMLSSERSREREDEDRVTISAANI